MSKEIISRFQRYLVIKLVKTDMHYIILKNFAS